MNGIEVTVILLILSPLLRALGVFVVGVAKHPPRRRIPAG